VRSFQYAGLSAVLYVAGYPAGLGLWPLACIALAPLLWCLERERLTPRHAFWVGGAFSVIAQLIGYSFLPETLLRFSGLPWIACLCVHLTLCIAQAGGIALWLCALAYSRTRMPGTALAFAAPLWVVQEQTWPNVFEAPLGAALHDVPLLAQSAELGGVGLLSLLLAGLSCAFAGLALGLVERERGACIRAGLALVGIAAIFGASAPRLASVARESDGAPSLRVGLVQASLAAEDKRRDPRAYAERYVQLSRSIREPVDLLIWPETALARPVPVSVPDMRRAHESLAGVRAPLLTGAVTYYGGRLFNSALLFDAGGQRIGRSDKHALIPFAERLPLGETFPQLYDLIPGAGQFSPGTTTPVLSLGSAQVATFICYEDMLAGLVRDATVAGRATLLVSLSNDAWFGESRAAYTHFAVARLRAIELRRTLVRATNTGVTAIIAPTGELIASVPEHTQRTVVARVPLLRDHTLYARWGDAILYRIMAAWLFIAGLGAWSARQVHGTMPAEDQPS
jgi:apolipoprotein N-acyltransferase